MKLLGKIKDKVLSFFAILFLLSLVVFFVGVITDFKYTWLSAICFIMVLPAINMWIWQWAETKKSKKFANKILLISIAISLFVIVYILNMGNLGVIPAVLIFSLAAIYFGWIAWAFILTCDQWWQKLLVVLGICLVAIFVWFINDYAIKVKTDNLSDIVHMNIFEGLNPPITKKSFIKQNGLPENIDVDYEEDDDNRYKVETLEYLKNDGKFYVIFIDEDYSDGYIQYEPIDLSIASFLRGRSYIKEKPLKSYTIRIKDRDNKGLKIFVRKDNKIDSIIYYAD
ncbi:hypothetical protein KAS42_02470 [bacterium]|nr:hypothetical protein [bacterium]